MNSCTSFAIAALPLSVCNNCQCATRNKTNEAEHKKKRENRVCVCLVFT